MVWRSSLLTRSAAAYAIRNIPVYRSQKPATAGFTLQPGAEASSRRLVSCETGVTM